MKTWHWPRWLPRISPEYPAPQPPPEWFSKFDSALAFLQAAHLDGDHPWETVEQYRHALGGAGSALREEYAKLKTALTDLTNQVRKTAPVDDHGHKFTMNRAYKEAVRLLDALQPKEAP